VGPEYIILDVENLIDLLTTRTRCVTCEQEELLIDDVLDNVVYCLRRPDMFESLLMDYVVRVRDVEERLGNSETDKYISVILTIARLMFCEIINLGVYDNGRTFQYVYSGRLGRHSVILTKY